jgi:hypothetical protein
LIGRFRLDAHSIARIEAQVCAHREVKALRAKPRPLESNAVACKAGESKMRPEFKPTHHHHLRIIDTKI